MKQSVVFASLLAFTAAMSASYVDSGVSAAGSPLFTPSTTTGAAVKRGDEGNVAKCALKAFLQDPCPGPLKTQLKDEAIISARDEASSSQDASEESANEMDSGEADVGRRDTEGHRGRHGAWIHGPVVYTPPPPPVADFMDSAKRRRSPDLDAEAAEAVDLALGATDVVEGVVEDVAEEDSVEEHPESARLRRSPDLDADAAEAMDLALGATDVVEGVVGDVVDGVAKEKNPESAKLRREVDLDTEAAGAMALAMGATDVAEDVVEDVVDGKRDEEALTTYPIILRPNVPIRSPKVPGQPTRLAPIMPAKRNDGAGDDTNAEQDDHEDEKSPASANGAASKSREGKKAAGKESTAKESGAAPKLNSGGYDSSTVSLFADLKKGGIAKPLSPYEIEHYYDNTPVDEQKVTMKPSERKSSEEEGSDEEGSQEESDKKSEKKSKKENSQTIAPEQDEHTQEKRKRDTTAVDASHAQDLAFDFAIPKASLQPVVTVTTTATATATAPSPTPTTFATSILLASVSSDTLTTATVPVHHSAETKIVNGTEVTIDRTETDTHDVHVEETERKPGAREQEKLRVHVKIYVEDLKEKVKRGLGL